MSETKNALDAVAGLMQERQKYESWLEALEARRASSPAHVFERVHADYEARLTDIMRRLGEHSPVLEEQARTLDGRVAALADDEREQRDLRAEAELRAAVGELAPEDWESLARDSDQALASLAEEQERVRRELAQVRELLAAATTPPRALTPIVTAAQPELVLEPAPGAPVDAAPATSAAPTPAAPMLAQPPVQGAAHDLVSVESLSAPEAMTPADTQRFDELEFLKSVADAVTPEAGVPTEVVPGLADYPRVAQDPSLGIVPAGAADPMAGPRGSGGTPLSENVTGHQPIVLRAETAATKTLKCSDCGAMNFPTEWYCERCGAELAAL